MVVAELCDEIKKLEERLLHSDLKKSPQLIHELLTDEFEEVGPAGQVVDRQAVVEWLLNKDEFARWLLEDFKLKILSDNLVLAIYRATQIKPERSLSKGSIRTSVWRRQSDTDSWQMVFHQATKIQ